MADNKYFKISTPVMLTAVAALLFIFWMSHWNHRGHKHGDHGHETHGTEHHENSHMDSNHDAGQEVHGQESSDGHDHEETPTGH